MDTPEKPKRHGWLVALVVAIGAVFIAAMITPAVIAIDFWLEENGGPSIPDEIGLAVVYLNWALATLGATAAGLFTAGTTKRRVIVSLGIGVAGFIAYIAVIPFVVFVLIYLIAPDSLIYWQF